MNPFTLVSARVRLWLYGVAGFSGLGLGAVTAYCEAVALPRPTWVVGASAALVALLWSVYPLYAIGDWLRAFVTGLRLRVVRKPK